MEADYDVLIIGAGLSGIGMACHLQRELPGLRFAVLERRQAIGGTWDLFRYPGIRSDSDMFSFGYSFKPWMALQVLADGPSIRRYVTETAHEYGVESRVQFGLKVAGADWSSAERRWTVSALHEPSGETRRFSSRFLVGATGYYDYDEGYLPHFPGQETFKGQRIHPQFWPENLDYAGKRVVVIGSGATAVTLVPSMAGTAAHVTMLQRSPSYIFSVPGYDKLSAVLGHILPSSWVFALARKRNITIQRWLYKAAKRWPQRMRRLLLGGVKRQLGPGADMRHFSPSYQPWDERLCAVPDGDLFRAIRSGQASVVTDRIETFTEHGIRLGSGQELAADIVITATGLKVQPLGGMQVSIDGATQPTSRALTYKGVLLQDVPNMAYIFGYTNAPWTLKADLAARYFCRLIGHMREHGLDVVTPRAPAGQQEAGTIFGELNSGYVRRAADVLPRQGRELPWRVLHQYERDKPMLLEDPIEDAALEFLTAMPVTDRAAAALAA